jgi:hypothetical protein
MLPLLLLLFLLFLHLLLLLLFLFLLHQEDIRALFQSALGAWQLILPCRECCSNRIWECGQHHKGRG